MDSLSMHHPIEHSEGHGLTWQRSTQYGGWLISILFAGLLNIGLFGLMPGLIQQPTAPNTLDPVADIVQVVRVKRVETPIKKKPPKPLEPKSISQPRRTPPKKIAPPPPKPVKLKPKLPFELNPALPKLSTSLAMPPLEHFTMDVDAPIVEAPPPSDPSPVVISASAPMKNLYGTGELDGPLTPVVKLAPRYPMRAKRRGIEGWVKVRFQVDRQGNVNAIEIIAASPKEVFDASVMNCVQRWRFKPGRVNGKAVNSLVETTIRFELN